MQVVETVEEVAQRSTEHAQDVVVSASGGQFEVNEIVAISRERRVTRALMTCSHALQLDHSRHFFGD